MGDPSCNLTDRKCRPCEGGVPPLSLAEARVWLRQTPQWTLDAEGRVLARQWTARSFKRALDFLNRVAALAEQEGHHPDLHLVNYREVRLELSTHAIGGLSENDFILAAKIDQLPIELRK